MRIGAAGKGSVEAVRAVHFNGKTSIVDQGERILARQGGTRLDGVGGSHHSLSRITEIDVERGTGCPRSMHLVPGAEADFIVFAVRTGTPIRIELVRKRACRANAFFLMGHPRRMSRSAVDLFDLLGSKFSVV